MTPLAVYCFITVAVSVLISSVLAIVWARSRSPVRYALSVAAVWAFISTLPLSERSRETATFPADAAHFFATMFWAAPFVIAAVLALAALVAAGSSRKLILLVSLGASVVAAPLSILSGLYGACSLGDCL
jgi:hypothetical protein